MGFSDLHPSVQKLCEERFEEPTLAQKKTFPSVLSGNNTLLIAPTGIGKTESAMLPVFSLFLNQKKKSPGITMLYITPLKALNRDMLSRLEWWCNHLGISLSVRHGDTTTYQRSKQAKNPPNLLILTPETLQSILPAKIMGQHLASVKYVVVDEVHELVDSKRGTQLTLGLERLVEKAGEFQRIGLSATVGSPETTAKFVFGKRVHNMVDVSLSRKINVTVESPPVTKKDRELVRSLRMKPDAIARLRRLHELVEEHTSVLTFVNTRSMAELLSSRYAAWDTKNKIDVHHSSLAKDVRVVAEQEFKDGKIKGLISTSSLELGIDIGAIDLVVQHMSPRQATRLVQRVGRSGHKFNKIPKGIVLAGDAEDCLEAMVVARRSRDKELEKTLPFVRSLDVLAHQLIGLSMDFGRVSFSKAYEVITRAYPFQDLSFEELYEVLQQLNSERYVWLDDNSYRKAGGAFKYYFFNVSMIPDEQKYFVRNNVTNQNIGMLDDVFVAENLAPGKVFITKGKPWIVLDIRDTDLLVEPASDITAGIPDWSGEELPVPFEVAQEVGKLRRTKKFSDYNISVDVKKKVLSSIKAQEKSGFVPDDSTVFIELLENFCVVHTHFGSLVNETLGKVLSSLLTSFTGSAVGMRSDAYRILFEFPTTARADLIKEYLFSLQPSVIASILEKNLERSSLFRWKFVQVAKRFGLFEKGADYRRVGLRKIIEAVFDSPIHEETLNELFIDKFDIPQTKKVLSLIQKKKIKVKLVNPNRISEFAGYTRRASDLFLPERAEKEISDLVKARILSEHPGFQCLNCNHIFYRPMEELPEQISCPKCKGKMVTLIRVENKQRVASLINAYGKRAVIALQARGVGPEIASRLLGRLRKDEESFYRDLVEAERNFAKTKRFWKKK